MHRNQKAYNLAGESKECTHKNTREGLERAQSNNITVRSTPEERSHIPTAQPQLGPGLSAIPAPPSQLTICKADRGTEA